jgi:3-phenylpropionate/trans-cinnamate dioxygenase ferredoxin reductase subunit
MTTSIVVVGAGECGARTALTMRDAGFDGAITVVGAETLAPYERPPLSKSALAGADEPSPTTVCSAERFAEQAIAFEAGAHAAELDRAARAVVLADGRRLPYDKLVLATGAHPRRLTCPGGESAVTLRTFADAVRLRHELRPGRRVAIIGGGFIGLEVAAAAIARGAAVTVVELAPRLMVRGVPEPLATIVTDRHRAAGVAVWCGVSVERIDVVGIEHRVELSDGRVVAADVVIAGVGAQPTTELAGSAGLAIDNGIRVDEHLRTDDPDVLAAGDCCSFVHPLFGGRRLRLESWRNAHDHAAVAARNALGGEMPVTAVPWFWSDQYELGLQIAGLPDEAADEIVRHRADGVDVRFGLAADGRLVSVCGVGPGASIGRDVRLGEMLIAGAAHPDPAALADPAVNLKTLIAHHRVAKEPTS